MKPITCKDDMENFERHEGSPWSEYDARGYYLMKVCEHCREERLKDYRPEVLTDPGYEMPANEPFEEEE
jgi:hypothetical protein